MTTEFITPKMRMVQGNAFEPNTKDYDGNPLVIKNGPNAGQARVEYFIAGAIAKNDPAWPAFKALIDKESAAAFPRFFPRAAQGDYTCSIPDFSNKIVDGDGLDGNHNSNAAKEGFAGHWVVKFSTGFAPAVYEFGKYDRMQIVTDKRLLKCGDYIRISGSVASNNNEKNPGVFINYNMVEITEPGTEIISARAPDASRFAGVPTTGVTSTIDHSVTVGLTMTGAYTYEALKSAGWTDEAMIAAGHATRPVVAPTPPLPVAPPPVPGASIPPAATSAGSPVPPPATPSPSSPPPPPYSGFREVPAKVMLPAAGANTYESLIAAGWTDAQLVQHGMMAA